MILATENVHLHMSRGVVGYTAYYVIGVFPYLPWAGVCFTYSCLSMKFDCKVLWTAFSALRLYALCAAPYKLPLSAVVFMLSIVPFVVNLTVSVAD